MDNIDVVKETTLNSPSPSIPWFNILRNQD